MIFKGEINTSIDLQNQTGVYSVKRWKLTIVGATGYDENFYVFDDVLRALHSSCWIIKYYNTPSFVIHSTALVENNNLSFSVQGDESHMLITVSTLNSPRRSVNTVVLGADALSEFMNFLVAELNSEIGS